MKRLTIYLLLLLFGCTSDDPMPGTDTDIPAHLQDIENLSVYPADTEPTHDIELVRETEFGDTESVFLSIKDNIAIDHLGHLYIGDMNKMHVYSSDGTYLQQIGQEGGGPGEFNSMMARTVPKVNRNYLVAYDEGLRRYNVYSINDFSFSHSFLLNPEKWSQIETLTGYGPAGNNYFILDDNTLLIEFRKPPRELIDIENLEEGSNVVEVETYYVPVSLTGDILSDGDDYFTRTRTHQVVISNGRGMVTGGEANQMAPYLNHSLMSVSENGSITSAMSDQFLIEQYDVDRQYVGAFYYPYSRSRTTPPDTARTAFLFKNSDLFESWPAIHSIITDDEGRLWVATLTDEEYSYEWWVLSEGSKILTKLEWEAERSSPFSLDGILAVKDGYIYAHETLEEEFGTTQIVRYRFELTER